MKRHIILLWGFWVFFLICEIAQANSEEFTQLLDAEQSNVFQSSKKFKCPYIFGTFRDPEDCSGFYICVASVPKHGKCPMLMRYSSFLKRCAPRIMVTCEEHNKVAATTTERTTSKRPATPTPGNPTPDNFVCPSFMGYFPHKSDCSKYYGCIMYKVFMKECPEQELFDEVKAACKPEKDVHCGGRQRPGDLTRSSKATKTEPETTTKSIATEKTPETTTEEIATEKTPETTTEGIATEKTHETTTEEIATEKTPETTTEEIATEKTHETTTESIATEKKPETTTEEIATEKNSETTTASITTEEEYLVTTTITPEVTTSDQPTGPPEHNCDEDDLDCIITETGDVDDWFICKQDVRSYPHPSSDKLFIFCMNWIPSVKKCGQDLKFSRELSTCVRD